MSGGSAKFNCPYRGRRTYSERGLRFHIRLYHPEKVEVRVNISIESPLKDLEEAEAE